MTKSQAGQPAPFFILQNTAGESIALSDVLQGHQNVLLVFLRHLG